METPPRGRLVERFVRAALLDRAVFAEVGADRAATGQAFLVVVLGGICNGLGRGRALGSLGVSAGVAAAVMGWFLWTLVVWAVGRAFGHSAGDYSLLRALGFANAPAAALLLRIVPGVGYVAYVAVVLWLLAATAVAVEAVFAIPRRRAIVLAATGFIAYWFVGLGLQIWTE